MREKYTCAILIRDKTPPESATPLLAHRFNKCDF